MPRDEWMNARADWSENYDQRRAQQLSVDNDARAKPYVQHIYDKYGIDHDVPINDALELIYSLPEVASGPSMWANPQERAQARAAYAMQGTDPADVEQRWQDSEYLLDPRTYQYMQDHGRHIDFLESMVNRPVNGDSKANAPLDVEDRRRSAIDQYENNAGERLYRRGTFAGSQYGRWSGFRHGLADAVTNPDQNVGWYMGVSETVPDFLRMQGSGESDSKGESWKAAQAQRLAKQRYRIYSPAAIGDLPDGASPEDISKRMRELRELVNSASVPNADERWQRTWGFTPPGWFTDIGDMGLSYVDPTVVLPVAKAAGSLGVIGKALSGGTKIAGKGWVRPIVTAVAKNRGKDFAWDLAGEAAVGSAIQAPLGGIPGRQWGQYGLGGGVAGRDFAYKNQRELADARAARARLYDTLRDDESIESANDEAYKRMLDLGKRQDPWEKARFDGSFLSKEYP